MKLRRSYIFTLLAVAAAPLWGDVTLPAIISDHMVLQRTASARVWGTADPGEFVSVTLDAASGKAKAGADGNWAVELDLSESEAGPFEMIVQGNNRIVVADVLVGQVWLASGQSNMAFDLFGQIEGREEIDNSANPMLRQFLVDRQAASEPLDDSKGHWAIADPKTSGRFTAVGYYFGKQLQEELSVPVGIINSSWGGTVVEGWTSRDAIDSVPELRAAGELTEEAFHEYPARMEAFVTEFDEWLVDNQREDKPCADPSAYAGAGISTEGWRPVQLPGNLQSAGLPETGALWLRKEVVVAAKDADKPFRLEWGPERGFESIYWNGQLIESLTYQDLLGVDHYRVYDIPADQVKAGANVLAVRIFAPVATPAKLDRINNDLKGEWLGKTEYAFPALDAQQVASAPVAPLRQRPEADLPGSIFNGMIAPIVPYSIRGVIWYQGEFNAPRAWQYRVAFPLMINDWRAQWQQGDFPFYFCQLPVFHAKSHQPDDPSNWAMLRESQSKALALPHTGQAVLIDTGEASDIHPREKRPAGERLAALALANDYGKAIPHESPLYESMKIEDGRIRVSFSHADGGLVAHPVPATYVVKSSANQNAPLVRNSPESELEGFAVCGDDQKWVWADAKIDGDTVVVWSDEVENPIAVRYGWATNPTCNLYNKSGFPASPFRTDMEQE